MDVFNLGVAPSDLAFACKTLAALFATATVGALILTFCQKGKFCD